jgi:hypothetical protein
MSAPRFKGYELNERERRFLGWLGSFCAPGGTVIGRVRGTVGKLCRRMLIVRSRVEGLGPDDRRRRVRLTGAGVEALLRAGWLPCETFEAGRCRCACPCHEIADAAHETKCCDEPKGGADGPTTHAER